MKGPIQSPKSLLRVVVYYFIIVAITVIVVVAVPYAFSLFGVGDYEFSDILGKIVPICASAFLAVLIVFVVRFIKTGDDDEN